MPSTNANLLRLCDCIIREHLGEIVEAVAHELLKRGRLNIRQLMDYTTYKERLILESLTTLLDLGLASYKEQQEGSRLVSYYSADPRKILYRARFGLYLVIAQDKFGELGELIVKYILLYGRRTFNSIFDAVKTNYPDYDALLDSFQQLADAKYIQPTTPDDVQTFADKRLEAEKQWKEKSSSTFNIRTKDKMKKELDDEDRKVSVEKTLDGLKRKYVLDDDESFLQVKKRKTVFELYVDDAIFWRLNYDQFHINLRNQAIVSLASRKHGPPAGVVAKAILDAEESKMISCKVDIDSLPMKQYELQALLQTANIPLAVYHVDEDAKRDIEEGHVNGSSSVTGNGPPRPRTNGAPLAQQQEVYSPVPFPEQEILLRLARYDGHFQVIKPGDSMMGGGEYLVPLKEHNHFLKLEILRKYVLESFGKVSLRLWNLLLTENKLDEKTISKLALTSSKETRKALYPLLDRGYIQMQAVPKRLDLTTQNTFFLYFVNFDLVVANTVETITKALANLKARRAMEVEKFTTTLEHLELGEEMSPDQQRRLDMLNKINQGFKVAEQELDYMMMVLNDF
ncbi:hypothetical protein SmJEL517_g00676 [Synchytrium microbalum]|uniref:DNA-directed RNA polymerase III subunit RPC3 n=1 Tax=Synchytrium microbalum TaxID=1806994 RepID=A0A507CD78_9FUNG|nr:uncharacterized protein SmJEL517_g00676 [Synchytrium microbalum]TPX37572.1 hypothetical protein SmJEL517_g00676 [Synchytrium microbalum]